jgi:SAM-dependent methyltransferase
VRARTPTELRSDGAPARGGVYTPPVLARWVAARLVPALPSGPVTVADLACGRGALLRAVAAQRRGVRLVGVDVDGGDLRIAAAALPRARLIHADALALADDGAFDGIVLNPPWGIALERARTAGFALARGQYDSADVFVELALRRLAPGGIAAFIVPDSLFFPDRAALRRLLLERTELLLVARLGEGFFPGVFRGTAVVVARNAAPAPRHVVECLRLAPAERRAVLAGERDLAAVCAEHAHHVEQARFAASPGAALDVAVRREQAPLVALLRARGGDWARHFVSGRGVELSKSGAVVRCAGCDHAWPLPRRPRVLACPRCGASARSDALPRATITRPLGPAEPGWEPLICGADVRRHRCSPSRRIRTGVPGISYKPAATRSGERILVRKTGVGLRAALDATGAHTAQVVFHYAPAPGGPPHLAAYVQGVLCSRVLLAYHLLASGETEWRSHPYVTQRVIDLLPIPDPLAEPAHAAGIAAAARALAARPDDAAADLALERRVAALFRLDRAALTTVAAVLDEAEGLAGIRELRFDPRAVA